MGSNIIELAKLGHERSAELKASCGAVDVRSLAQLISDLATQLEVQFVRSTNMAVQLANAESKCRELAAENVGLKEAAEFAIADDMWIEQSDGMLDYRYVDWYVDVLKAAMETPATDAYLAEVRAQGVEMFADYIALYNSNSMHHARSFVTKLRKGAAL
ncbi:hypothetical protein OGW08_21460 [Citrobacter sp. Cf122]|uniref:hypothetical protein n=1 Tax=Citrobacter sp. Cf122 TaxID=2985072 RepID=UPI002578AEF5|nr:hypothetical protein [Citrobacter sp. Cf122]MDM3156624.1 hypothetical protein [Citrobacter sp. Cf122]